MLQSRHIVVADFPDGSTATVYQGADAGAALAAQSAAIAEGKAEAVMTFAHPLPVHIRYPLQERAEAEARTIAAAGAAIASERAKAAAIIAKREQAKKLMAEAKAMEKEV